jgi:flagellar biosynthesis/type III secretory pathway chaperone
MTDDPLGRLHQVLSDERQAFMSGDYAALAEIAAEKEHLLNTLQDRRPSRKSLEDLRQTMEHNQRLAEAALKGVQAASARIGALMQVQAGLTTYDPDGKVTLRTTNATKVERKA